MGEEPIPEKKKNTIRIAKLVEWTRVSHLGSKFFLIPCERFDAMDFVCEYCSLFMGDR